MTPRFYCPLPLEPNTVIELPPAPAHHALRVLRLGTGAAITLFNGEGGEFSATLEHNGSRKVHARIGAPRAVERESPLAVTLAQGLASVERMDYAIQKAVELGVAAIVPVATARSVTRLDAERAEKRRAHWQQIAIGACEQCGRNRVPEVQLPYGIDAWLRQPSTATLRLLLLPDAEESLTAFESPRGAVDLLVGPEGGLSADETTAAMHAGFRAVRLGPRTLRTETAGLVALTAMNALWGDLR